MKSISTKISAQNASTKRNGNLWRNFVASLVVAGVATGFTAVEMAQADDAPPADEMSFEIDSAEDTNWEPELKSPYILNGLEDLRKDYEGSDEDNGNYSQYYSEKLNINFKTDDSSLTKTIKLFPTDNERTGHILVLSATNAGNNSATISPKDGATKYGFLSVTGDVALQVTEGSTIKISGFDAGSSADGGAIFSTTKITLGVEDNNGALIFDGNKANYGGAICRGGTTKIEGDNIGSVGVEIIGGNNTFSKNTAAKSGGAIFGKTGSKVLISGGNNNFVENTATANNGGAIWASIIEISGGTNVFTQNQAGGSGGAIYIGGVDASGNPIGIESKIDGAGFVENTAVNAGGAIRSGGTVTISNSEFNKNKVTGIAGAANVTGGGAIFNEADGSLTIENSTFTENKSNASGGAIYSSGDLAIVDSNFTGNTAEKLGGAIYAKKNLTINANTKDIVFSGNKANNINNDIFLANGADLTLNAAETHTITFGGGIVSENNTSDVTVTGGRVILGSGSINTITGNILVENTSILEVIQGAKFTAPPTNLTLNNGTFRVVGANFEKDEKLIGDSALLPITLGAGGGTIDVKTNGGDYTLTNYGDITGSGDLAITNSATQTNTSHVGKLILDTGTENEVGAISIGANAALENQGQLTATNVTVSGMNSALVLADTSTNNFSGAIKVENKGTVEIADGATFTAKPSSFTLNDGTMKLTGNNVSSSVDLTLGTGGGTIETADGLTGTLNGKISNANNVAGSLTKTGDGTLVLGVASTYTGTTTIEKGTLKTSVVNAIASSSSVNVASGATLDMDGKNQTLESLGGGGTIIGNATADAVTLTLQYDTGNQNNFSGVIEDGTKGGKTDLVKTGDGALTILSANSYTGATTIDAGTLALKDSGSIANSSKLNLTNTTSSTIVSTFDISATTSGATVKELEGVAGTKVILGNKNLTVGDSTNTSFAGIISGSANSALTKTGTGNLTLLGENSYTGKTDIQSGTLTVGSGGSLIVTAVKEQDKVNAQIIIAKDATLTVATGGTLKVNAGADELKSLTAGQSEKFYFAKGASESSIGTLDIKGTVDFSGISSFVYNTSAYATDYGTNDMFVNVTRKTANEIKHVSSSVAQSLASYQRGKNSFLENVLNSQGSEAVTAEQIELGFNAAGAGGVGTSVANVAGAFRGGVQQQLAGTAAAYTIGGGGVSGQAKRGASFVERSIWVAPTYGHQQATSLSSGDGNTTFGYTADQYGLAFGAEARQGRVKLGVAAQLGGGITTSADTLAVRTQSDSFFGGVGIYGTTPVTRYVDLISQLGWVGTSNKLTQNNAGGELSADVTGGLVFYSISFEKKVYFGRAYMTPLVGFDYGYIYQNAYHLKNAAGVNVIDAESGTAHMVMLPIGLRLGYDVASKKKGYGTFTPEVSARCLPNVGDYELPYDATPTGATAAKLRSLVSDRVAGDAAIGLTWRSARNELGVRYGLLFSEHFTNQDATFMYRRKF